MTYVTQGASQPKIAAQGGALRYRQRERCFSGESQNS